MLRQGAAATTPLIIPVDGAQLARVGFLACRAISAATATATATSATATSATATSATVIRACAPAGATAGSSAARASRGSVPLARAVPVALALLKIKSFAQQQVLALKQLNSLMQEIVFQLLDLKLVAHLVHVAVPVQVAIPVLVQVEVLKGSPVRGLVLGGGLPRHQQARGQSRHQ